jgi:uncharacterized protein (DUF433 family)/DNA-binding transcriptional MerR regulator
MMRRDRFDPLEVPNYGFQEAVRYLHVPNSTLHYWMRPSVNLLAPIDRQRRLFSFKNLVECYVLNGLREIHGVRVSRIRYALTYLRKHFPSKHPLADYELKTDGRWIFFWHQGDYLNLCLEGQKGIATVLDTYLRRIEREWRTGKWILYPFTRLQQMRIEGDHPKVIAMNPKICFGMPVLSGTRITTATLASRFLGGDSVQMLATSYGRPEEEIKEAIFWETGQEQAA